MPCCREDPVQGISINPGAIELIRLINPEDLEQEAAAERPRVSRRTAWRDLHKARCRIADALGNGKGITMTGCMMAAEERSPRCPKSDPEKE